MKLNRKLAQGLFLFFILPSLLLLTGCGKKTAGEDGGIVIVLPDDTTTTTTTSSSTDPLLTYEVNITGGTNDFSTPAITTDGNLKVRFLVGSNLGSSAFQGSELRVTIAVNGHEVVPTYTSANYEYGRTSDGPSEVINFTGDVTAGVSAIITITNPQYDFYCLYPWNNALYGQYPGCRKGVLGSNVDPYTPGHTWSGTLIVETSNTESIE